MKTPFHSGNMLYQVQLCTTCQAAQAYSPTALHLLRLVSSNIQFAADTPTLECLTAAVPKVFPVAGWSGKCTKCTQQMKLDPVT